MHTIFLVVCSFFCDRMDTEKDIEIAAANLMMDTKLPKLEDLDTNKGFRDSITWS